MEFRHLFPLNDITDTDEYLLPPLLDPEKYSGKTITAVTAYYTDP